MANAQIAIANSIRDAKNEIADKCAQDPTFRANLLSDPAGTIEGEYSLDPGALSGVNLNIIVEEPNSLGILIPPDMTEMELSDDQLDMVSGGAAFIACGPIGLPIPRIPIPRRPGGTHRPGW